MDTSTNETEKEISPDKLPAEADSGEGHENSDQLSVDIKDNKPKKIKDKKSDKTAGNSSSKIETRSTQKISRA